MPAPPPLHRLLRSPKIAGGLLVVLAGLAAIVGGGVSYAHHAAARSAALRLQTSAVGIGVGITVTVTVTPNPVRSSPVPRVTATVTSTVQPSHSPAPPKPAPPPVLEDNGVGTDAGGLFDIFPGADILVPAQVSPSDPAQLACRSKELTIAPGGEGTQTCTVISENGFSATLAVSCERFIGLTPAIATDCTVPAMVNLPANGVATINAVFDLPASATDNDYFFLRLTDRGQQIQAPNEWEVIVQLPPQPPAQLSVTCALVPPPGPDIAVGQCQFQSTQTSVKPTNPGMFFDYPQLPVGAMTPDRRPVECWAADEAGALQAAQDTSTCPEVAPIPSVETSGPDVSGTYWFAIPLGGLPSGAWEFPVHAEVDSTTVITPVTFTLAADGTISWP